MLAANWRDLRSALSGGTIRLAGFAVIFALLGMFVQMVTVAYPILAPSSLTEVEFSSALNEDALPTDEPVSKVRLDKSRLFQRRLIGLV